MTRPDLRVGIIGVGMMGADHAERIARRTSNAVLVAVSDPDVARAESLAGQFDGVRSVPDPLALIADPGLDAVVIASPGWVHEPQVLACIEAGKPTLCEKPLTMDGDAALRLVLAERRADRALVQVGFMRRFDPEYVRLKSVLDSGRLGRLLLVHNTHRNKTVPDTFRSEMAIRDSLVHEVDVARFLFGEEITEISVHRPTATSAAPAGTCDPQVVLFRMSGGALVTTEVFVRNQVGYEVRCEAVCERGTVMAGRPWSDLYLTGAGDLDGTWGGSIPADFRDRFARAYDLEVQAWVDAARRGEVAGPTTWDGYAATVVCEAGMASLESGAAEPVRLAQPAPIA